MKTEEALTSLGKKVITSWYYLGGMAYLFWQCLYCLVTPPFSRKRIFEQAKKAGNDSLGIVALVSLFIGFIFALQTAYFMSQIGSEIYIASLVGLSLVREMGPVITALVVAGRVGASITAELGTMQVTEQIDALETLGSNPVRYLVVPRFVALAIMMPVLTLYADLVGILGSYIICVSKLGITSSMYIHVTADALAYKDIFTGLFKTIIFGMIIAISSSYEGFNVEGGAEGVGKATTRAVVSMFILIIAADCVSTAIFYFLFP